MTKGTKSVLFGAHQFIIHPLFVARAWSILYGFPFDPRLWVAFFVHDFGYWGKVNMDDEDGETHPLAGARLMSWLFDRGQVDNLVVIYGMDDDELAALGDWGQFSLLHSRFYSKRLSLQFSKLCVADKLSIALEPAWLYLPRVKASGELSEYMKLADERYEMGEKRFIAHDPNQTLPADVKWFREVQAYCKAWAWEHVNLKKDEWTPSK